jgi:Protein of unknown function (DUF4232)
MRIRPTIIVFTLGSMLAGGCGASATGMPSGRAAPVQAPSASPASALPSTATKNAASRCRARALLLRPGPEVVPMTGEHAVLFELANRGSVPCTLDGYPAIVLYSASGAALRFRYAEGGGAYVTSGKPGTVVLAPGASAYILVAKYRCDLGSTHNAAAIRLSVPAALGVSFVGREELGVSGAAGLAYCQGGQHDPGQIVAVSPVEPTQQAAMNLH